MQFVSGQIYHIYNRGNNKQSIFFYDKNYWYFHEKVRKHISPTCDILAWCLMPNHFHFLIHATDISCESVSRGALTVNKLSDGFGQALSGYSKAINVQEKRTGNLFQQRSKSKSVLEGTDNYALIAFHYIHQNPLKAGLADRLEHWEYSSYLDYAGLRKEGICNKDLAVERLNLNLKTFAIDSYAALNDELVKKIF